MPQLSRRELVVGTAASALVFSGSGAARAPTLAHGFVFDDVHGDGRRRPGSAGVPGVMVSNGRDVVRTDEDGRWQLFAEPGEPVFVIKPPQWATPLGLGGIPQFSQPSIPDFPGAHGARLAPSGDARVAIDFPLRRQREDAAFEALLVTDTQPEDLTELAYVRDDILVRMLDRNAAFGVNHGDVVADDLSLYPHYLRLLDATGMPWHHCPGNHDLDNSATDDAQSRETWKRTFGARHYAFQYAGVTVLVLDNVEYLGRASGRYRGAFGQRQLEFVRNVLANVPADQLVVASMHIPLTCYLEPANPADITADRHRLLGLLSNRPNTVSFAGHLHATEHHYLGLADGFTGARPHHHHVLTAACGSWWSGHRDGRGIPFADSSDGSPNGFHVLTVEGSRYTTAFVPAAGKPATQLRVMLDGPHCGRSSAGATPAVAGGNLGLCVPADALGLSELVVNLFDGGPRSRVCFEVAGSSPIDMVPAAARDPLMLTAYSGAVPRKSWVKATASSHLWKARLPGSLRTGAHRLSVSAVDEYGRRHAAQAILDVVPPAGSV